MKFLCVDAFHQVWPPLSGISVVKDQVVIKKGSYSQWQNAYFTVTKLIIIYQNEFKYRKVRRIILRQFFGEYIPYSMMNSL